MPDRSVDRTPRYNNGEIEANVVDFQVGIVNSKGYVETDTDYGHHTAIWFLLEDGGSVNTTNYDQNRKKQVQTIVQQNGSVNIGTEEYSGRRVGVVILDEKIE